MTNRTMTEDQVQREEAVEVTETVSAEVVEAPAETTVDTPAAAAGTVDVSDNRSGRKVRVGVVVADKSDKTVTVKVERRIAHPLYGKGVSRTKKYHAHDEKNEYRTGDTVRIMETRPLSKTKRWRVVELIERPE
jgi:small subunit ribosomal protein S17